MIFGIGIDVLEAARVKKVYDRFGEHFVERLLLPGERAQMERTKRKERFLAMRFAAKEAFLLIIERWRTSRRCACCMPRRRLPWP